MHSAALARIAAARPKSVAVTKPLPNQTAPLPGTHTEPAPQPPATEIPAEPVKASPAKPAEPRPTLGSLEQAIWDRIRPLAEELVANHIPTAPTPIQGAVTVTLPDRLESVTVENAHPLLPVATTMAHVGRMLLLHGPAGSGKTVLATHVAKALGMEHVIVNCSEGTMESHLWGSRNIDGTRSLSDMVQAIKSGQVVILDEMDTLDPGVAASLNSMLANRCASVAGCEQIVAHEKTVFIATVNTLSGATVQYNGRQRMDGATMDRFRAYRVAVDYAPEVEEAIANGYGKPGLVVLEIIRKARQTDALKGCVFSTRLLDHLARLWVGLQQAGVKHNPFDSVGADMNKDQAAAWNDVVERVLRNVNN